MLPNKLKEKDMEATHIPAGTKCIVKEVPKGTTIYGDLPGAPCVASEKNSEGGARNGSTQLFDMTGKTGHGVFANGDSGFVVVPA
jgi:hypothetical protein